MEAMRIDQESRVPLDRRSASRAAPWIWLVAALSLAACSEDGGNASPTTPLPPPAATLWGAHGCSQTRDAIFGYHMVGGQNSWPDSAVDRYGGGDLLKWQDPNYDKWAYFETAVGTYGAEVIWFQICVSNRKTPEVTDIDRRAAEAVVEHILEIAPGATLYASGMPEFVDIFCQQADVYGSEVSVGIADYVVSLGLAQPGPVMPPLDPTTLTSDNCHANDAGMRQQGSQVLAFFG